MGLHNFRSHVAVVSQDDRLLAGSVAENICMFESSPDMDWIEACAKIVCVHGDINALPMRYFTVIGDLGASVSSGQREKILIARALYRRPTVLVLDEAMTHMDTESIQAMDEALRRVNMTRLVLTQRPESVPFADVAYVLRNGRLVDISVANPKPANTTKSVVL